MTADRAAMIAIANFRDFVLKKDESGIWRKFEFCPQNCDYSNNTSETFADFEEASEYMRWLSVQIGSARAARLNAL